VDVAVGEEVERQGLANRCEEILFLMAKREKMGIVLALGIAWGAGGSGDGRGRSTEERLTFAFGVAVLHNDFSFWGQVR